MYYEAHAGEGRMVFFIAEQALIAEQSDFCSAIFFGYR